MAIILESIHFVQYYIIPFVVVLGVMIFFHELGHFLTAKYFGVKVLKFALGFGPVLLGKTIGETEYSIRYFPLGGFVKMLGEDIENDEDTPAEPDPDELHRYFNHKHPLKRMVIVAAGPFFNLVLALFIFCCSFIVSGLTITLPEIGQITENSPAETAGFLKGDLITDIDGQKISRWSEIKDLVKDKAGIPLDFIVQRNDSEVRLTVTPEETVVENEFGESIKSSLIGIVASGRPGSIKLGPLKAIQKGFSETTKWIKLTFLVVWKLLQGIISINTLGGPILIGQMTGQIAQESVSYLVPFTAIISVNLGIINLFPIPILDGGLILFLLLELIMGKPLSIKARETAMKIGLALLILLMLTVTYNDIGRLITGSAG